MPLDAVDTIVALAALVISGLGVIHSRETRRREEVNRAGIDELERTVLEYQVALQDSAGRAAIAVSAQWGGDRSFSHLEIANRGGGPAVGLTADITPIEGASGFQVADLAKFPLDLQPSDRVTIRAALAMGSAQDYAVRVSWADPDGRPHEQTHRIEFRPV